MAMDDQHRLLQALLIDGVMTRPEKWTGDNRPVGEWIEAKVIDVSIMSNPVHGWIFGAARFVIDGQQYAKQATFHDLWGQGWTTTDWRRELLHREKIEQMLAQRKRAKKGPKKRKR